MNRNRLFAVAALVGLGLVALWWYSSSSPPTTKVENPAKDSAKPATAPARPQTRRRPQRMGETTRPATDKDVPRTSEEAAARPEVARNKSMAEIRSSFAAGRYDEVITQAKNILAADPERPQVRAFLAMSWCAVKRETEAREQFDQLPDARKQFVATKCRGYGIELPAP